MKINNFKNYEPKFFDYSRLIIKTCGENSYIIFYFIKRTELQSLK